MTPEVRVSAGPLSTKSVGEVFAFEGVRTASIGNFSCRKHDDIFQPIDTTDIDFNDSRIRDLLWFRAVLREAWLLHKIRPHQQPIERFLPPSIRIANRLRSLSDCIQWLRTSLMSPTIESPADHIVRRVKSEYPILATSYAYGGSTVAYDGETGMEIPTEVTRAVTGREPRECWGFTVIPREAEHVVVASWLKGSQAANYFQHFKEVDGRELEAAVSAELIGFCESWFLRPRVWESYNKRKKDAIVRAYRNSERLAAGGYRWIERGKKKWYEFMNIHNRHQINLFRYDKSVLEDRGLSVYG